MFLSLPGRLSVCCKTYIALKQSQPSLCFGLFIDGGDISLDHAPGNIHAVCYALQVLLSGQEPLQHFRLPGGQGAALGIQRQLFPGRALGRTRNPPCRRNRAGGPCLFPNPAGAPALRQLPPASAGCPVFPVPDKKRPRVVLLRGLLPVK